MQFYIYENAMWPRIAQKQQHKKSAAFSAISSVFFSLLLSAIVLIGMKYEL